MDTTSSSNMMDPHMPSAINTRLQGHWLVLAWIGWSILALLSVIDFISSIHEYLVNVQMLCRPGSCLEGQPTQASAQVLHKLGLSVTTYAAFGVGLVILSGLVCCAVAVVIVWRKPRDWMALLVSITLITQGLYEDNYLPSFFDNPLSPWHIVGLMLGYLAPVLVLFSVAFFPNGRPVPRWIGWLLAVICLVDLPPSLFPSMPYGGLIETLFVLSGFPLIVGSLIYRYRRVSTPLERQQIKWVVFGITLSMVAFMGWFVPQIFLFSSLSPNGSVYDLIGHPLLVIAELCIPICIGIAVLRYHLWDIDVIINKALVYAALTTTLVILYTGMVLGLQTLLGGLLHQTNAIALVVSTLVIAALFQPVRARLQTIIDRRFYRKKYDARRVLTSFSATLQSEVDLNTLCDRLLSVVQETMQPASVSLWLAKSNEQEHSHTGASAPHLEE